MPAISELNRRITVNTFVFGADSSGGNIKALLTSYDLWAKIEQKRNNRELDNLQVAYKEAYDVTVRNELSRPFSDTNEIVYEERILSIQGIRRIEEGARRFNLISTYTTGSLISDNEIVMCNKVAKEIHFVGTGTEFIITDSELVGWNLLLVFRDGVQFLIKKSSVLVPVLAGPNKEVAYDADAGSLEFYLQGAPLQDGEIVDVYLIN